MKNDGKPQQSRPGRRNRAIDLADHMFAQLERIAEAETAEDLETEVKRGRALNEVAGRIIENQRVVLDAHKIQMEYSGQLENANNPLPALFQSREEQRRLKAETGKPK